MADNTLLIPAAELAAKNKAHFPNERPEYRQARDALLAEEIELRRHIERVAALRRALPPGGEIPEDYTFDSEASGYANNITNLNIDVSASGTNVSVNTAVGTYAITSSADSSVKGGVKGSHCGGVKVGQ